MAATKEDKDKLTVRKFKNANTDFWCGYYHYTILNGELILAAGGIETQEIRNHMLKYLKTKGISLRI